MKDYRYLSQDIEVLGRRLDAAQAALAGATSKWAQQHWKLVVDRLLFQWHQLPVLHDAEARTTIIPRWTVSYDFFDRDTSYGYGITDRMFDAVFRTNANLEDSWNRAREARLARANTV